MAQEQAYRRQDRRLLVSCLALAVLYFLMEASFWWTPGDENLRFFLGFFIGVPCLFLAPVLAFILGAWFASGRRWHIVPFLLRMLSVAYGCVINVVANARVVLETGSWHEWPFILSVMPSAVFLAAGMLTRLGSWALAAYRHRRGQEPAPTRTSQDGTATDARSQSSVRGSMTTQARLQTPTRDDSTSDNTSEIHDRSYAGWHPVLMWFLAATAVLVTACCWYVTATSTPDVTGMRVDDAETVMKEFGFKDVHSWDGSKQERGCDPAATVVEQMPSPHSADTRWGITRLTCETAESD